MTHTVTSKTWVEDIETKLEQLLDLYLEDRKRLLSLLPPTSPSSSPPMGPSIPPNGRGHHRQRPKPFLLGKQVIFLV
ncbi:unnamed protein product, partial [Allacma fusca]